MRARLLVALLLLLVAFTATSQTSTGCATNTVRNPSTGKLEPIEPYARGTSQEGLPIVLRPTDGKAVPAALANAIPTAAGRWGEECPAANNAFVPTFSFQNGAAPPGTVEISAGVAFKVGQAPPPLAGGNGIEPAKWQGGVITLYELCPSKKDFPDFPCSEVTDANGNKTRIIDWNDSRAQAWITHELGHAMGIGHDRVDGTCKNVRGLMREVNQSSIILPEHCALANQQNCNPNHIPNPGQPPTSCPQGPFKLTGTASGLVNGEGINVIVQGNVNGQAVQHTAFASYWSPNFFTPAVFPAGTTLSVAVTNPHAEKQCTASTPGVVVQNGDASITVSCQCINVTGTENCFPDGEDPTEGYIDRQPGGCEFCWFDDPWWTEWPMPGPPAPGGNCETRCVDGEIRCDQDLDADGIGDCYQEIICTPVCESSSLLLMQGPTVGVSSPRPGESASGTLLFSGFARDGQGVRSKRFYIDRQEVVPAELIDGAHVSGAGSSGFSGKIDVSNLAPGPHLFSVIAVDDNGDYKIPTVHDVAFQIVSTCGDGVPPTVSISDPDPGAIVSGSVRIVVTAQDNVRVARVEISVDGTTVHTLTVAPYVASWNSSSVSNGQHTIVARAFDSCGNVTVSGGVTVEVRSSGERPPRARNDRAKTTIGGAITIDVLANDSDPDGDTLALTDAPVRRTPLNGSAARVSATSIRYTPNAAFEGNDAFEYEITDSTGRRDRAWVTVEVAGVNERPIAADDTAATAANASVTIDVTANDRDPNGDAVALIRSPFTTLPLHGYVERLSASSVVYTPYASFSGTDRFEYEIGDGKGLRARAWVTVAVTNPNRAPLAVNDSATTGSNVPVTIDVTANDSDPDGDAVFLVSSAIVAPPLKGVAMRVSPTSISYTPDSGFAGTDSFQYEIGDGNGKRARATVTITVTVTNRAPEAFDDNVTTTTGTAISVDVTANDSDADGDRVGLIGSPIVTAPANGTAVKISGTTITYTPKAGYSGTDRFQYEIGDGHGARARAWVNVTIAATGGGNRNPVAADDAVTTRPATAVTIHVTANDSDPDGDPVTLIASPVIVAPSRGTAVKVDGSSIAYTPSAGFVGTDRFQYEAGDGRGARTRGWVTITVTDANSRPVAVDDLAFALSHDGSSSIIDVTRNDWDPDTDSINLVANPIIVAPANGTAATASHARIAYTPRRGFVGTDRFQYEIGDGRGARSRAWVNVTVVDGSIGGSLFVANNAPVAANDTAAGPSDVPLDIAVLVNDADGDGDPLILPEQAVVTLPRFGSVRRSGDETLTYYPTFGFSGNDAFEYEVHDGRGGRARAWVAVQIPGTNRPPVAVNDAVSVMMNRSATFDALANDSDADGDPIVLAVNDVVRPPLHGTTRRVSDTQIAYTPSPDFFGTDVFVYEITDGRGATAQASVVVTVYDQSFAPDAVDDAFTVESGKTAQLDVLVNDTDPDGEPLHVVSSTQPANGTVTWDESGTRATYQSNAGFTGTDTFTYTIADPRDLEDTATVTVTVNPVRRAPVVANDSAETKTRTAVLIGVLANDYDPDWNRLTVKSVTQPARGTVVINRFESVTYTPASDFAGTDTFTYTAADGTGLESTATVTVKVLNNAPAPRSEILAAPEDTWVGYSAWNVLSNDTDPDGDELKVVLIEQPVNGTFQLAADYSQFSYKAKENWFGMDSFYYTVSDPFGAKVRVLAQISVSSVNDSPACAPDAVSTWKNQALTIPASQLVANDRDIENHSLSIYLVSQPVNGRTEILPDNSVKYSPYGEFVGTDTFTYTVVDSGGAYGEGTVTVTVKQDTAPVAAFNVTCNGRACLFDASASTDDRGIVTYQWTLGNYQAASGKTFNYTYPVAGVYAVRLTIEDGLGQRAITQKTIIVNEPPPDAVNDFFSFTKGYARYISYADMLRNDTDPAGDVLTVTSTDASLTDGTLTCDSTGCVFTPLSKYWYGQTTFKYTVDDGHGKTDTATVTIEFRY